MIIKLLRRFCSEEVRLMLTHLEEHPEDFDVLSDSNWYSLLQVINVNGTFIEQLVTSNVRRKSFKRMKREQFKQSIVKQTIAPEKRDSYKEFVQLAPGSFATSAHNSMLQQIHQRQRLMNAQQAMANQMGIAQAQSMHLKDPQ